MTRMWYYSLAMMLGTISTNGIAFGQYGAYAVANNAGGPNGLAPSSYPIQVPGFQPNMGYISSMPNAAVPMVPTGFNPQIPMQNGWFNSSSGQYQLVAQTQPVPPAQSEIVPVPTSNDQAGGTGYVPMNSPAHSAPSPQSAPMQYAQPPIYDSAIPTSPQQSMQAGCNCSQPMYNQGYQTMLAPNSTGYMGAPMTYAPAYVGCNTGECGYGTVPAAGGFGGGHLHNMFRKNATGNRNWFIGAGVLFFNRIDDDRIALTYDTGAPSTDRLSTQDARMGVMPGFEIMAGRYINCGRNAIVGSYWGLFPETEMASATTVVNLRSRHPFTGIEMPGGPTVYDWYDGAVTHRIERSSQYHNVEANLLGFGLGGAARSFSTGGLGGGHLGNAFAGAGFGGGLNGCGTCGGSGCNSCAGTTGPCCLIPPTCGSRLNLTWLTGFRYFRFEDNFQYAASNDGVFNGDAGDLYYDIDTTNDLVGFQAGGIANYCVGKRVNVFSVNKVGVYNNYSTYYARIGTNEPIPSVAIVNSLNGYNGQQFVIDTSKNDIALLAETGIGMGLRMTRALSATVSYRAIAASGIATAVTQIPFEMTHLDNVRDFDNNSSLILHGLQIGGLYNF